MSRESFDSHTLAIREIPAKNERKRKTVESTTRYQPESWKTLGSFCCTVYFPRPLAFAAWA